MDNQLESVSCAICDGDDTQIFIRGAGPSHFVRCRNDGLLYMNPRPKAADVRKFRFVRANNLELFGRYRRNVLRREAEAIKKLKPSGNLLDVGCATGTFFENFSTRNWRLYGADTSPLGVEAARAKYKAEVFCGTLREARYPTGFFDVVTILDTLYYTPDPKAELAEIYRVLKQDALLAVEIPGLTYSVLRGRGPLSWLLDRKWSGGFAYSRHLYYFGPLTMKLLLENVGFHPVKMIPEQASLGRNSLARILNEIHFALAKSLFKLTAGRISVAGKEFYLSVKAAPIGPQAQDLCVHCGGV